MDKIIKPLYTLLIFTGLTVSCKKILTIDAPASQIVSSTVFSNDATSNTAIAGIYRSLKTNVFTNTPAILTGLASDEIYNFFPDASWDQFKNNAIQSNNSTLHWSALYNCIYQCNAAIEGLQTNTDMVVASKDQYLGEAKFIRALCYLYLANLWGEVPLITSTNVQMNAIAGRAKMMDIYRQIIEDLTVAQTLLPGNYSFSANERTRANKWAATALLSRVYLYNQDWMNAESHAASVIDSGNYSLNTELNNIFVKNNNEAILQLANNSGDISSNEPFSFITTLPTLLCTESLLNAFESGDQRRKKWVGSLSYLNNTYYYPYKYKVNVISTTEYYTILRLAEQYLIRAEARAHQNNIPSALSDLNIIRRRAGLPDFIGNNQSALLSAIEHERQIELFAEMSHRWFDLKRTGRIDAVLGFIKGANWQSTDALFPIPLNDIQRDLNLKQNPGY